MRLPSGIREKKGGARYNLYFTYIIHYSEGLTSTYRVIHL